METQFFSDLANVFGVVGAITIVACIALWRAWGQERRERLSDWKRFDAEVQKAQQLVVDQMELRIQTQKDTITHCLEMSQTLKEVTNALARVEGAMGAAMGQNHPN